MTSPQTSQTYDAVGNLLTSTDADGNVTTYTYDALNRIATVSDPAGASTPAVTVSTASR